MIDYRTISDRVWNDFIEWSSLHYDPELSAAALKQDLSRARSAKRRIVLAQACDRVLRPCLGKGHHEFRVRAMRWFSHWDRVRGYSELTDFATLSKNPDLIIYPTDTLLSAFASVLNRRTPRSFVATRYLKKESFLRHTPLTSDGLNILLDRIETAISGPLSDVFPVSRSALIEAYQFLDEQFERLIAVTPHHVINDGGLTKVIKVVLGMIFYTLSFPESKTSLRPQHDELLLRAVKAGYYWGVTYPLVDGVFDVPEVRDAIDFEHFNSLIVRGIRGEDVEGDLPRNLFIRELHQCCVAMKELVPLEENPDLYEAVSLFHSTSVNETRRSIERPAVTECDILTSSMMKAGLVRVCAAGFSGMKLTDELVTRYFVAALHNQVEDDALDFVRDSNNRSMTAFTAFADGAVSVNPLLRYMQINQFVAHRLAPDDFRNAHSILTSAVAEMTKLHVIEDGDDAAREFIDRFAVGDASFARMHLHQLRESHKWIRHISEEWPATTYVNRHQDNLFDYHIPRFTGFANDAKTYIDGVLSIGPSTGGGVDHLTEIMTYLVGETARRLRSVLTLAVGDMLSVDREVLVPIIRAIEFFHAASLAFDDLPCQDDAATRRGRPCAHLQFGEANTQLAAISLISLGYSELASVSDGDAARLLISSAGRLSGVDGLCGGQARDLLRGCASMTKSELEDVARLKTGSAISFSLCAPAIVAGEQEMSEELSEIGSQLGFVYQILDDLNDAMHRSSDKDVGIDKRNRTATFASVVGIDESIELLMNEAFRGIEMCKVLKCDAGVLKGAFQMLRERCVLLTAVDIDVSGRELELVAK